MQHRFPGSHPGNCDQDLFVSLVHRRSDLSEEFSSTVRFRRDRLTVRSRIDGLMVRSRIDGLMMRSHIDGLMVRSRGGAFLGEKK
jgi:hypothetical protein